MLLPDSVEQYVGPEHPVRIVDAFVDGLDLRALGFGKSEPAATGRPPYHPGDLLRLYLWGYLNRVTSSRRLERECARNLELLWLLRRLQPDFKTIADFRRANAEALPRVFREFTLLARELGLFGRAVVVIDGTQLKASNHPARQASAERIEALIAGIDARIAGYLSRPWSRAKASCPGSPKPCRPPCPAWAPGSPSCAGARKASGALSPARRSAKARHL